MDMDQLGSELVMYWDGRANSYSNGVVGELADERKDAWVAVLGEHVADQLERAARDGRTPHVADIGCGPGFFSVLFAERGWQVSAIDASAEMLARAQANVAARIEDAEVEFVQCDFGSLPFEADTFDLVVGRNVTWLMRDPEGAYAEWLRVLRPGGKMLMFDANWYRYLVDPQVAAQRAADQRGNVLEGWDEDAQATSDEEKRCEELASNLPLTGILRPAWDLETLARLGTSSASADEDVWLRVWPPSEQRYYGATPMFLVEATK